MAEAIALSEKVKLDQLATQTQRSLLTIKSAFPFDLFPDTVRIDENKVEITKREFFVDEKIFPIIIANITGVVVTTNPFFATMKIEVVGHSMNPDVVRMLRHDDAIKAKRIIMGLVTANKQNVNLSQIPFEHVREKVEEIGKALERQLS